MARMTSVEAWEPALPPLEMMSGMKSARTVARAIWCSKNAERRGGEHLADQQHREPAAALAQHLAPARLQVRDLEGLHAAELLGVLGGLFLHHVDDVVGR
jgi:hypothetical protein